MPCGNTLLQDPECSDRLDRTRLAGVLGTPKRDKRSHDGIAPGGFSTLSHIAYSGSRMRQRGVEPSILLGLWLGQAGLGSFNYARIML